ncbi:OprO/OprP family phosphate-selective porin [Atopomonas sediminilitoris]|uniref:OprO/OprP family phosphate-selective porin n=1 Tax=Atopomonas sediminilitoris TaxID=2919919 RepID=UPI001F4DB873|nr:porin [Atopomonas sediminilitoris]MCJ8170148.1 porin [Atopomonas sediminilitoris]
MTMRKQFAGFAISAVALAVSAQAMAGTVTTDGADIIINTKSGLEVATSDKQFSFKLGGKLQWDAVSFDGLRAGANAADPFGTTTDTFIRRGELGVEGVAYKNWGYGFRFSYDRKDAGDDANFDRAFITYNGFEGVGITIGRYGMDYGLENTTSSSWITGIERPFMYDFLNGDEDTDFGVTAMHAGSNYGLAATLANRRGDGAGGRNEDESNKDIYEYTLRGTFAPYMEGTDVVHLGLNYHNSNADNNETEISTRMGIRSDDDKKVKFATVEKTDSDSEWVLESGAQFGAVRLQAEYFNRSVEGDTADTDVDISGYHAQVSYMINGVRKYKADAGKWDKPSEAGAVELFARYESSTVDADAQAIADQGGVGLGNVSVKNASSDFDADAFVLGVNYFPTPAVRVSLNYVDYEVSNLKATDEAEKFEDDGKAIQARLQYVF